MPGLVGNLYRGKGVLGNIGIKKTSRLSALRPKIYFMAPLR